VVNHEVSGEIPASPGEVRSFLVSYYPVRGVGSEIQGIGSVIVDITARKRLDDERTQLLDRARDAEARYRTLFENLADPVFVADLDARHVDANHAATELLGYSREELLGRTLDDVVAPDSGWTTRERARLASAGRWRGDLELRHRNGSRVPVEARSMAVALPGGTMYVTVARDLTERRRAEDVRLRLTREEAIRATVERERARLWTILDHAPAGISYLDTATRQILSNSRAKALFALPPIAEITLEISISQIRAPDGRLLSRDDLPSERALRGETTADQELVILHSDGQPIPILVNAAPILDDTGKIEGAVVVFQDIASLKDLERVREEFLGAVAHELRSPISVIRGYAQFALLRGVAEDSARQAFTAIIPQTDRIARTIDDLLLVQNLRPGPRGLTTERVDLSAAARVVIDRAARERPSYVFRLTDGGAIEVVGDPSLVDLLLTRLIENALRYSPRESPIEIGTRRDGSDALVSIQDHGVGIPLDRQTHVFAPFYETVPAGASGYVGVVSLDLYLSKQIVEAHGGRIWFTSRPEQGSTFFFTLPLAVTEGPPADPASAAV
ncbi:MAG: PAS domain-containing sensor histidine kinase, partial [Chloroflexota bacterium]